MYYLFSFIEEFYFKGDNIYCEYALRLITVYNTNGLFRIGTILDEIVKRNLHNVALLIAAYEIINERCPVNTYYSRSKL